MRLILITLLGLFTVCQAQTNGAEADYADTIPLRAFDQSIPARPSLTPPMLRFNDAYYYAKGLVGDILMATGDRPSGKGFYIDLTPGPGPAPLPWEGFWTVPPPDTFVYQKRFMALKALVDLGYLKIPRKERKKFKAALKYYRSLL